MKSEPRHIFFLPIIAIIPAFLGGATDRWSEGIALFLLGLLLVIRPPRWSTGGRLELALFGLMLLSAAAFLPANWFGIPPWRVIATDDYGLKLGTFVTPQPWMTLESILLFTAGMAWFYYCLSTHSFQARRVVLAKSYCAGVTVLAGVSIALYFAKTRWPFWNASELFGPFPNRNQMGDLLAIGAVISIACVQDELHQRQKTWVVWIASTLVLLVALVLAYSRASIILFFAALILWVVCLASTRASNSRTATGAGLILILWSAFLFGGGETLRRFLPNNAHLTTFGQDLRWNIQRDTLDLLRTAPFTGIGLGNFESQFWMFHRALGLADFHVLHPESDWLWFCTEVGCPALLLLLVACGLLMPRIFPFGKDRSWRLRAAAMAGGLIFVLHGLVDVSAHRLGSAFGALFVIALAIGPRQELVPSPFWLRGCFRCAGVVFCAVGAIWVTATCQHAVIPGAIGVTQCKEQIATLNRDGSYAEAIVKATSALEWAPMDWELYYFRGISKASASPEFRAALADFSRARYLNPVTPALCFNEGKIWLRRRPALAVSAWQDALKRAGDDRKTFFSQMLDASIGMPRVRDCLRERASGDPGLILLFLAKATQSEFEGEMADVLRKDPELFMFSPAAKQKFMELWEQRGDKADLVSRAVNRESWLQAGWPYISACHAAAGNYQLGYELARHYMPPPIVPPRQEVETESQLQRDLYINPRDFPKGYCLYATQIHNGARDDALTTLEKLTAFDQCPRYFFSLKASLYAESDRWMEAWEALKRSGLLTPAN